MLTHATVQPSWHPSGEGQGKCIKNLKCFLFLFFQLGRDENDVRSARVISHKRRGCCCPAGLSFVHSLPLRSLSLSCSCPLLLCSVLSVCSDGYLRVCLNIQLKQSEERKQRREVEAIFRMMDTDSDGYLSVEVCVYDLCVSICLFESFWQSFWQ